MASQDYIGTINLLGLFGNGFTHEHFRTLAQHDQLPSNHEEAKGYMVTQLEKLARDFNQLFPGIAGVATFGNCVNLDEAVFATARGDETGNDDRMDATIHLRGNLADAHLSQIGGHHLIGSTDETGRDWAATVLKMLMQAETGGNPDSPREKALAYIGEDVEKSDTVLTPDDDLIARLLDPSLPYKVPFIDWEPWQIGVVDSGSPLFFERLESVITGFRDDHVINSISATQSETSPGIINGRMAIKADSPDAPVISLPFSIHIWQDCTEITVGEYWEDATVSVPTAKSGLEVIRDRASRVLAFSMWHINNLGDGGASHE